MRSTDGSWSHRRPAWRGLMAAGVLVALAGCGGPPRVALAELVTEQRAYDGEEIVVRGVVVDIDQEGVRRHAVVQDQDGNRVEIAPFDEVEPHMGAIVEVTGEFEFDPERGRVVHAESIEPAGP